MRLVISSAETSSPDSGRRVLPLRLRRRPTVEFCHQARAEAVGYGRLAQVQTQRLGLLPDLSSGYLPAPGTRDAMSLFVSSTVARYHQKIQSKNALS